MSIRVVQYQDNVNVATSRGLIGVAVTAKKRYESLRSGVFGFAETNLIGPFSALLRTVGKTETANFKRCRPAGL